MRTPEDQATAFECLRLALGANPGEPRERTIERAEAFLKFVEGRTEAK